VGNSHVSGFKQAAKNNKSRNQEEAGKEIAAAQEQQGEFRCDGCHERDLAYKPSGEPYDESILCSLRELMRGFHDFLRQNISSVLILLGQISISITFLMIRSNITSGRKMSILWS
jgi:hypothetical protein